MILSGRRILAILAGLALAWGAAPAAARGEGTALLPDGHRLTLPAGMAELPKNPEETGLEAVRCEGTLPPCCYSVGLTDQIIVPVMLTVQGKMRPCDGACEEIVPCRMTAEEVRKLMNDPRERMTETCLMYLAGALGAG